MPSPHPLHEAPWWAEFVSIKDDHGWAMLSKRYGVGEPALKAALEAADLTKAAAKAGRRKASASLPPPVGVAQPVPPWEKWKDRLGSEPDGVIARAAGVTADTVKSWRRALKIPAFQKAPPAAEPPAPVEPPATRSRVVRRRTREDGTREDTVVERVSAAPVAPVASAHTNPLDAYRARMGVEADGIIAAEAGVDRRAVVKYRQERGIPAYTGFRFKKGAPPAPTAPRGRRARPAAPPPVVAEAEAARPGGRRSPIDAHVDKLGVLPDAEVAAIAGTSPAAVLQYRRRRGIAPAPARPRRRAAAAVVPAPAVASAPAAPAPVEPAPVEPAPVEPAPAVAAPRGRRRRTAEAVEAAPAVAPSVEPVTPSAPAAPAPSSTWVEAYRVRASSASEEVTFTVVAGDFIAAAERAVAALAQRDGGPWAVQAIKHRGQGLA